MTSPVDYLAILALGLVAGTISGIVGFGSSILGLTPDDARSGRPDARAASGGVHDPDPAVRSDVRIPHGGGRLSPDAGRRKHRTVRGACRPELRAAHVEISMGTDRGYDAYAEAMVRVLCAGHCSRNLRDRGGSGQ